MNANLVTTIVSDAILVLGLVLNYLKTRSVAKTAAQNQAPKP